jgi:hypothetical protein
MAVLCFMTLPVIIISSQRSVFPVCVNETQEGGAMEFWEGLERTARCLYVSWIVPFHLFRTSENTNPF